MANHSRIDVVLKIRDTGIVPVFYHPDASLVKEVVRSCYEGGIRVFEFTNRGDFAHEVFAEVSRYCRANLPDLALGVGSVIDAPTAALYLQLGSSFVVSPLLDADTARVCNRRKVLWVPGCGSVSEVSRAEELGAEIVKIFPGTSVGGPDFVKSIRGPMPWSSLMPTGGVAPTKENLKAWFDAGVVGVGMGSKLFTKEIIRDKDFALLEEKVKEVLFLIREIRGVL
jgi:2-dehydro-3-deoxyphosphogluconate aldolase/(4S)-4-hydroxy-2-oxoglutarate aldolase